MINRIKIHFNDVWEKFSILSSLDEQSWTPVLVDQDAENNSTMDYSVDITARYLKVVSAGVHLGIREFEVYGTGLADGTPTEIISPDSRNNVQKILLNGQLYILRGDACYTLIGTEVLIVAFAFRVHWKPTFANPLALLEYLAYTPE